MLTRLTNMSHSSGSSLMFIVGNGCPIATKAYLASGMPFAWYRLIRPMQWITWRAISNIVTVNVWPFILRFRHLDWCYSRTGYRKPCRSYSIGSRVSWQSRLETRPEKLDPRGFRESSFERLLNFFTKLEERDFEETENFWQKKTIALSKPTERCAHKLDWFILHDGGGNWSTVPGGKLRSTGDPRGGRGDWWPPIREPDLNALAA